MHNLIKRKEQLMQCNRLSYFAISTEKEQRVDNLKFDRTLNTAI